MATVVLVRHGRTAMTGPVLAGWTPGLHLDERGRREAAQLSERLSDVCFVAAVSSPLDRCLDTAEVVLAGQAAPPALERDHDLGEVHYGDWTGRPLGPLRRTALWRRLDAAASTAVFPGPGGEALRDAQHRSVRALRARDRAVEAEHGRGALWLACSHGDIIKGLVADALGMHLDLLHRVAVDPCSITVVRFEATRTVLLRLNDTGSLPELIDVRRSGPAAGRAGPAVGGGG